MVNRLHLYSAFIQNALQIMPLIHPFTHTFTHQRRLAAMQGTNQLVRSNWGLGVLLKDTSKHPGWIRTGNPPTARRQLLPPEPYRLIHPSTLSSLYIQNPSINQDCVGNVIYLSPWEYEHISSFSQILYYGLSIKSSAEKMLITTLYHVF